MVFKIFFLQAVVLAEYLEKNQEHYPLQGKTAIELGAGTGLVSMVAALLGKFYYSFFNSAKTTYKYSFYG